MIPLSPLTYLLQRCHFSEIISFQCDVVPQRSQIINFVLLCMNLLIEIRCGKISISPSCALE